MKNKLQQIYIDILFSLKKYNLNNNFKYIKLLIIKELYKALKFILKTLFIAFILLVTIFNMDIQHTRFKTDKEGNKSMVLTDCYTLTEVYTPVRVCY